MNVLEQQAAELDQEDPLAHFRQKFVLPPGQVYLCGHSLGLSPKAAQRALQRESARWGKEGVAAWFADEDPWYTLVERVSRKMESLVGARPYEVVAMNNLTTNLHLMLSTFYQPTKDRHKILVDGPLFPSDRYALASHMAFRGIDANESLLVVPLDEVPEHLGADIALVYLNGVHFLSGAVTDMAAMAQASHQCGARFGLELAHAVGNIPLALHEWEVDFAVWCGYKYLNAGPGGIGAAFIHQRHWDKTCLPRLAGWWGHDSQTRFRMQLEPHFVPDRGALGWQLGTPPVLLLSMLEKSLELFEEAGLQALWAKRQALSKLLWRALLEHVPELEILTPLEAGCMVAFRASREIHRRLKAGGILGDFREPDIIRWSFVPLYNRYCDIVQAVSALLTNA